MAVVWGIRTWIWAALGAFGFAGSLLIARVLVTLFGAIRELTESIELSGRLVASALETAREEADRAQARLDALKHGALKESRAPIEGPKPGVRLT